MNKRPILVAFSNQKGGVGKSTVTIVLASYFNYVKGLNVAVVDCDYPQFSLDKLRGRDLKNLEKSEYHQRLFCRQFENSTRKAYPIVTSTPEEAAKIPGRLEGDYDLIFFDLPGTVNSRGVFESVMNMDFIFTPIVKDRMVMQSSLSFVSTVQDFIGQHPNAPLKDIRLFWNRMDSRTSKELFVMYNTIISRMGLKVFDTVLPDLERFNKEMTPLSRQHFRCTLLPPSEILLKDSRLEAFAQEMERIISRIKTMAKKREIFKVNEDALKDMMPVSPSHVPNQRQAALKIYLPENQKMKCKRWKNVSRRSYAKRYTATRIWMKGWTCIGRSFWNEKKLSKSGRPISVTKSIKDWPVHFPFLMQI